MLNQATESNTTTHKHNLSFDNLSCVDSIATLTRKFNISSIYRILLSIKDGNTRKIVSNLFKNAYKVVTFSNKQMETALTNNEFEDCIYAINEVAHDYELLNKENYSKALSPCIFEVDTSRTSDIDTTKDDRTEELEKKVKQLTDENAALRAELDVYKAKEREIQQVESELDKFFVNHREKPQRIHDFVELISGAQPTAITTHINNLIYDGYMDKNMVKKELYDVLNKHNLYTRTYSTFSTQVQV